MELFLSGVVAALFSVSVYLLLGRSFIRIILGIMIMSNAANLLIFTAGRIYHNPNGDAGRAEVRPPLIAPEDYVLEGVTANPLPQALILTAIVIGFSLLAFILVLSLRANSDLGTLDTDRMRVAEPVEKPARGTDLEVVP